MTRGRKKLIANIGKVSRKKIPASRIVTGLRRAARNERCSPASWAGPDRSRSSRSCGVSHVASRGVEGRALSTTSPRTTAASPSTANMKRQPSIPNVLVPWWMSQLETGPPRAVESGTAT